MAPHRLSVESRRVRKNTRRGVCFLEVMDMKEGSRRAEARRAQ
jgi:hypothetical protein